MPNLLNPADLRGFVFFWLVVDFFLVTKINLVRVFSVNLGLEVTHELRTAPAFLC